MLKKLFILLAMVGLTVFPLYRSYYYGLGFAQYKRHKQWLAHESPFFNPWQYRILSPLMVEAAYQIYDNTIEKIVPLSSILPAPEAMLGVVQSDFQDNIANRGGVQRVDVATPVRYFLIFTLFRLLQHLAIYYLFWRMMRQFVPSNWLLGAGLLFICFSMGNSVKDSDLSFNTYTDVILYLAAAIVVIERRVSWWIVPLTALGALNRETALLIPVMYFIANIDLKPRNLIKRNLIKQYAPRIVWLQTALSGIIFLGIFIAIRQYYGLVHYEDYAAAPGLSLLKTNLFSFQSIFSYGEWFGTMGFLPFIALYGFRQNSPLLQRFGIAIVPFWFGVQLCMAVAWESRMFMVPTFVAFLPLALEQMYLALKTEFAET